MCLVKTPKIPKAQETASDKPLPILRNPLLDGLLGNIASNRAGTNPFRIDLINPLNIPTGGGAGASGYAGGGAGGGGGGGTSSGTTSGSTSGTSSGSFGGGGGGSGSFGTGGTGGSRISKF